MGKDKLLEGKLVVEHSLGLGHRPNVIPPAEANIRAEQRTVEIGWHPVAGFAGKWFAEQTGLGKKIAEKVNKYPDPTQHWAVLVGEYCHELWMVRWCHFVDSRVATYQATGRALACHLCEREDKPRGVAHVRGWQDYVQRRSPETSRSVCCPLTLQL